MNAQFKKGVLDLVLLHLIHQKPLSAYDILVSLRSGLHVNENTIYPLLRRLESEGYLAYEKSYGEMGAPKKVFVLTKEGQDHYQTLYQDWKSFQHQVSLLLGGNQYEEK